MYPFWAEIGAATTAAPYGFWATNPTKKLAHWVYLLGQPLSRNRVFQNFSGEPPPLKHQNIWFERRKSIVKNKARTYDGGSYYFARPKIITWLGILRFWPTSLYTHITWCHVVNNRFIVTPQGSIFTLRIVGWFGTSVQKYVISGPFNNILKKLGERRTEDNDLFNC